MKNSRKSTFLWIEKARASQIRELQSFVTGIERDKVVVAAGLTLPYNNGLVEVNKLKPILLMGYGRAGFALLRQRIIHALLNMAIRKKPYLLESFVLLQWNRLRQIIRAFLSKESRCFFAQLACH